MNKSYYTLGIDWEDFSQNLLWKKNNTLIRPDDRIDRQTNILIELLNEADIKATFFVSAALAQYTPALVKRIATYGHEIGLHGYHHVSYKTLTPEQVYREVSEGIKIVSDIISQKIHGFRAPYCSIDYNDNDVLEILADLNFLYDSSMFNRKLICKQSYPGEDIVLNLNNGRKIVELPLATFKAGGVNIPIAGGSYWRVVPGILLREIHKRLSKTGKANNLYMHPYELDPSPLNIHHDLFKESPFRLIKNSIAQFRWNFNRKSFKKNLISMVAKYNFITCYEKAIKIQKS
ncbi:MAG: polysaccharide deacetylase family protein [Chitinophagaceae bacterium]|nr:polysaccharide deacetylase family protein [Chitinophagaceae bacterium]